MIITLKKMGKEGESGEERDSGKRELTGFVIC